MGEGSPGMDMEQQQGDIQAEVEAQEGRGQSAGEDRLPLDSVGTGDIPVVMRNARSMLSYCILYYDHTTFHQLYLYKKIKY